MTKLPENKYYVYCIFDPDTGQPRYIGKGCAFRYNWHRNNCNTHHNFGLRKLLLTHSELPLVIIRENLSNYEACITEIALIKVLGKKNTGGLLFNITDGGEGINGVSQETRIKMREAAWRRAEFTDQHKLNMSFANKNSDAAREHIQRLANLSRGKKLSEEHKEKVRQANLGATRSDAAKQAMSEGQKRRFAKSTKISSSKPWIALGISETTWRRKSVSR